MKLFATDLDGTLLDREDGIHPKDRAAIQRARERGVIVTIATGRLTGRTHPIARSLSLDAPLVCADGGVLACSTTERVLAERALAQGLASELLEDLHAAGLSSFVFTHEHIHACGRGLSYHPYVRGWSHSITTHDDVRRAEVLAREGVIMLAGIGPREVVDPLHAALAERAEGLEILAFDLGDARVLRVMTQGATKGAALLELATSLGVVAENMAVIGDWHNDLSMFEVAGHAFAMPAAPAELKAVASHVLTEDMQREGAIAHALERWLAELG
jgi:Cof subfamily protein (haloacid dehalogenase superfamily)